MRTPEEIIRIKEDAEEQLLKIPGVTMVAVGQKLTDKKLTGDIAILVYVESKRPIGEIPAAERVPDEINGVKTDIIESGRMRSLGPYRGGSPVESSRGLGGTLGCFAFTNETPPKAVLLTNQHVVMDGTSTTPLGGEAGPVVCSICSPCCSKVIGHVSKVVVSATLDGAIATLNPGIQILPEVEDIGVIKGTHPISSAEANSGTYAVKLYSRMKGTVVTGTVQSITATGISRLHDGSAHRNFNNQIAISSAGFSISGDSGSVVFNNNNEVVGLVFGGNDAGTLATASLVAQVESELQIRIARGTAAGQVFTVPGAPSVTTAGDPVAIASPLTGGISIRSENLRLVYKKILSTAKGREYDQLYHKHMSEVRALVNTNKKVATIWHRNQGPAFLVHFSNSLRDKTYRVPDHIKNIRLTDLFNNMAIILTRFGSASLQHDIAEQLPGILLIATAGNYSDDFISALINQDKKCLIPQEQ